MSIKERLQSLKDTYFPRKLGYVFIPISEEEKKRYGNFSAYLPIKYAKKFGLDNSREVDTLDFAAGTIKHHNREKPLFDGIILNPSQYTIPEAEKAMKYMAEKYKLPVSAEANGEFIVQNPNLQLSQAKTR